MTDPLLEFRSLDFLSQQTSSTGEGIRIQIVRGFLAAPEQRGEDFIVAARAGRIAGSRIADVLPIGLAGYITARTPEAWRGFVDDLYAVLDESGAVPGSLIARAPYLGLAAGYAATITARVKNVVEGPIQAKLLQTFSIELESIDPYWTVAPA